jgi:hypothetical protein
MSTSTLRTRKATINSLLPFVCKEGWHTPIPTPSLPTPVPEGSELYTCTLHFRADHDDLKLGHYYANYPFTPLCPSDLLTSELRQRYEEIADGLVVATALEDMKKGYISDSKETHYFTTLEVANPNDLDWYPLTFNREDL